MLAHGPPNLDGIGVVDGAVTDGIVWGGIVQALMLLIVPGHYKLQRAPGFSLLKGVRQPFVWVKQLVLLQFPHVVPAGSPGPRACASR